jgi:DNA ligase D-like protein (predicted ligase)
MLPVLRNEPFDSADHIFEVKWDGVRVTATVAGGTVLLRGQNQRDVTHLYPELATLPDAVSGESAVLDGMVCAWGEESQPSFDLLRPRLLRPDEQHTPPKRSSVIFQVFDVLELDGRSILRRPLFERRNILHERLQPGRQVQVSDFVRNEGIAFFEAVAKHRLLGVIAKDKYSPYLPGQRSSAWQEIRAAESDDFVIGGYTFGGGRRKDPITSLLLGAYRSDQLEFTGEVSVGCSDREARQLLELLTPLHASECPFAGPPGPARFVYWCRPELACHVRYSQWGPDGRLRFPVFVSPRPDVPPRECLTPELVRH